MGDDQAGDEGRTADIHHAEAILSASLGITVADAVGVLRTIAHCSGTPVGEAARRVLARPGSAD